MLTKDKGTSIFHPKDINWSILSLGYVPRIQKIPIITAYVFAKNQTADNAEPSAPSNGMVGQFQPPKKSSTVRAAMVKVLM